MGEMLLTCPFWDLRCSVVNMKPRLPIAVVEQYNDKRMILTSTEELDMLITVRNVGGIFFLRTECSLYGERNAGFSKERWKPDVKNVLFIYLFITYLFTLHTSILYTFIYDASTTNAMWVVLKVLTSPNALTFLSYTVLSKSVKTGWWTRF